MRDTASQEVRNWTGRRSASSQPRCTQLSTVSCVTPYLATTAASFTGVSLSQSIAMTRNLPPLIGGCQDNFGLSEKAVAQSSYAAALRGWSGCQYARDRDPACDRDRDPDCGRARNPDQDRARNPARDRDRNPDHAPDHVSSGGRAKRRISSAVRGAPLSSCQSAMIMADE